MSRLSISISLLLSLISCKTDSTSNVDRYEIYGVVFDSIIGKKDTWRKKAKGSLLWLTSSLKTKNDSLKNSKLVSWLDSTNKVIDTAKFYVIIEDTLLSRLPFDPISEIALKESKVIKEDSTFAAVLRGLYKSRKSIETIDRSKIRHQTNYKIVSNLYRPRNEFKEIGSLSFSRIAFDESGSKACVYVSLTCGSLCGYGRVFFLNKESGQWVVLGHEDLWIS